VATRKGEPALACRDFQALSSVRSNRRGPLPQDEDGDEEEQRTNQEILPSRKLLLPLDAMPSGRKRDRRKRHLGGNDFRGKAVHATLR
jgi:hypothetical protein